MAIIENSAGSIAQQTPDDPRKQRIDDLKDYVRSEPAYQLVADRVCSLIDALYEELTGDTLGDA